jgi:phosphomannomutase
MSLKFGTSGVRGLVTEMTDRECFLYASAFVDVLKSKSNISKVCISGDFRSSTPRILKAIQAAILEKGLEVEHCGYIPTPALAAYAMAIGAGSIMVTGSHIPDDRNGIKFYMTWGEILKAEEEEISKKYTSLKESGIELEVDDFGALTNAPSDLEMTLTAQEMFCRRYTEVFAKDALSGYKIVFYQHSTVGREIMPEILEKLGAEVMNVGWSDTFVPVDTEAVEEPDRLAAWVKEHGADLLMSADGDGDRPLVVDDQGKVIRGDLLGLVASKALGADSISTPVSCNTALEKAKICKKVNRTQIGSPYVITAMNQDKDDFECVVGYEANGGYLTGSMIQPDFGEGVLAALPTRDAVLPVIALLLEAKKEKLKVSELLKRLPARFTSSGIIREVPMEQGKALVQDLRLGGEDKVSELFGTTFGDCVSIDWTDGVRITFEGDKIVHYRPSGNAPEFRCYTEAASEREAETISEKAMKALKELLPNYATDSN